MALGVPVGTTAGTTGDAARPTGYNSTWFSGAILVIVSFSFAQASAPSYAGFTLIRSAVFSSSDVRCDIHARTAGGSESSTYARSVSTTYSHWCFAVPGAIMPTASEGHSSANTGTGATITGSAVSASAAGALLLFGAVPTDDPPTSSGMTRLADAVDGTVVFYQTGIGSGSTGTRTTNTESGGDPWAGAMLVLDEGSTSGPGSPTTLSPADNAVCVALTSTFTASGFTENLKAGTGNILIKNLTDASTIETIDVTDTARVSFSSTSFTVTPTSALPANKLIAIQVASGAILSTVDDEPWTGITNDTTWNVNTYDVGFVSQGGFVAAAAAATSIAVPYPAGIVSGDKLMTLLGQKPATANAGSATTPGSQNRTVELTGATDGNTGGYTTTLGADTGNVNAYAFEEDATGSESGTLSITVDGGTNSVVWGAMYCFRKRADLTWSSIVGVSGKRTQNTTPAAGSVSEAMGSDPAVTAGDYVLFTMVVPTDVNNPATWSAEGITQTGVTYGTVVEAEEPFSGNGNDIGGFIAYVRADSGTSSAAPTVTATKGGTTTNSRGPILFVRLRAAASGGGTPIPRRMLLGVGF